MITFKKDINELICFKDVDGVQDLVHTVVWTLLAADSEVLDDDSTIKESFGMRCEIPNLPNTEFTPFNTLDEQTVLEWIDLYTPAQRMQAAEQYLIDAINEKKTQSYRAPPGFNNTQGD